MGVAQPVDINAMATQIADAVALWCSGGNPSLYAAFRAEHHADNVRAATTFLEVIYAESPEPRPDNPPQ